MRSSPSLVAIATLVLALGSVASLPPPVEVPALPAVADPLGLLSDCGKSADYTAIWEIQGNGTESPLDGERLELVVGIVTADFLDDDAMPDPPLGFYLQAHEDDCDPTTSNGIFVYTGGLHADAVAVGQVIALANPEVREYKGPYFFRWTDPLTELICLDQCSPKRTSHSAPVPEPLEYDPPADPNEALLYNEAREGMLVQVSEPGTVIAGSNAYNEFVMVRGADQDRVHRTDGAGRIIMVDADAIGVDDCGADGWPPLHTFDEVVHDPDGGSWVRGPLAYNFNMYKVQQDPATSCVTFTEGDASSYHPTSNPPPAVGAATLSVGTLNTWNLFDTHNDPHKGDPILDPSEYDTKLRELARTVCDRHGLNQPHVIGLQEIEHQGILDALATRIQDTCQAAYTGHTFAGPDDRSIQVGALVRTDKLQVVQTTDRQGCSTRDYGIDYEAGDAAPSITCTGATPHYLYSRPPLEVTVRGTFDGQAHDVHLLVNHFKSKLPSSRCTETDCTDRRVAQAQHVADLVRGHLDADPNAAVIVLGDLNDHYDSAPLDVLDDSSGLLHNVWTHMAGPPSTGQGTMQRYSYTYNGAAQTLDHMLVSDALAAMPHHVSPRHLNTDHPATHIMDGTMYRAGDHDPLLVTFEMTH